MRKLLLFILAVGVSTLGFSQNVNSFEKVNTKKVTRTAVADDGSFHGSAPVNKNKSEKSGTISGVSISSSGNVYGYLVENQSALTANEDIGVIHFTHRADPNVIGVSTGDIISSQSRDGGWTWTQTMAFPNASGYYNRYPGGQLYNPTGNTDPDNAYVVVLGPSHDGASANVWQHMFMGSFQLDSSNFDHQYLATYGAIVRMGFQGTSNGKFYVISSNYQSSPYSLDTLLLYEGTWDGTNNKVNWTINKFDHNFVIGSDGSEFAYVWGFNTAWSADGTTGYYWTIGRDSSNDTRSYQPIVWKSSDSGANWAKMPVYDFSNITTITDELRNMGDTAMKRPQFTGAMDGVVDANGNLHLISRISSAFSNNDDSLDYSFTQTFEGMPGHNTIFDVYTTSSGWAAKKLGYVYCVDVADADSPYGSGTDAIGWDLRLQAGRTTDGTKIYASWTDTDTSFALTNASGFPMNSFPDIHYAGLDVTTGNVIPDVNYTEGTSIAGDCYFHYMSDIILTDANGDNIIPLTELDLGTTPLDPVAIKYIMLSGVGFNDANQASASVSQNRPNPFSGITNIEVTLSEASNLSIEVLSVTGQKVSETNYGMTASGLHTYQIDASNLSAGMYFYTVRTGNSSITKKMIVR